jgi:hypothetical protein
MTQEEVKSILLSGCKFKYYSYDHKKAELEYRAKHPFKGDEFFDLKIDCFSIPDDLKEKYKTEKVGKIRSVYFNPKGEVRNVKIGSKYSKTFYCEDFGVKVFPILTN